MNLNLNEKSELNFTEEYGHVLGNGSLQTLKTLYNTTVQFVGVASVSVPAGTFKACQFERTETVTTRYDSFPLRKFTTWVGVGNGITLKTAFRMEDSTYVEELISASINGMPVTP